MIAPLTASELHRLVAGLVEDGYPAPTNVSSPVVTESGTYPGTVSLRAADVEKWAALGFGPVEWRPFVGTGKQVWRAESCGFQLMSLRDAVLTEDAA